jgi:hypothetical protein
MLFYVRSSIFCLLLRIFRIVVPDYPVPVEPLAHSRDLGPRSLSRLSPLYSSHFTFDFLPYTRLQLSLIWVRSRR